MRRIIKNFKKYRFLLTELIIKDIKLKYRRSYLGILWTLLEPLLTTIVLTIVFGSFYGKSDKMFPLYVVTGRLLYTFFANATKSAMKSIRSNGQMIKKVYVPKYIYPLSSIIAQYVTFLISLIVLIGVAIYTRLKPTVYVFEAIIPLFVLFVMVIGVGLILATMEVFFRDMEYLWGVMLMMIMYCSAIFYHPATVFKTHHGWILKINPLYSVIVNFREAIMDGVHISMGAFLYSAAFAIVTLILGVWMFYKNQDKFILNI
jgi:ABC-type polysaccharide/polyol phosphate export systems, permease component